MGKITFLWKVFSKKIDKQIGAWNSLDQKIGLLSGFAATIIGAEVILMMDYIGINIFSFSIFLLFISLTIGLIALRPRNFHDPINPNVYYTKKFLKQKTIDIKNKALADSKECYKKNGIILKRKSLLFEVSIGIFVFGILLLVIGAYQLKKQNLLLHHRKEVTVCMSKNNDKEPVPTEEEEIIPVAPSGSPGTVIEKGEDSPSPVQPSNQPGSTMPFGETKGGIKLTK